MRGSTRRGGPVRSSEPGDPARPLAALPRAGASWVASVVSGLLLVVATAPTASAPAYLGSAACAECHTEATAAWQGSDHARAWTLPGATTELGDFGDVTFEHAGRVSRFFRDGDAYLIETEGPDGERRAYPVVGVAGIDPLQQYLLSPEPGRTQVYDIAWDVAGKRWYPVFPDQRAPPGDGLHWTGPYKSWEARCAECHATGYSRNHDPATNRYAPRMAETGVGCEACHGPGSAHVDWARRPDAAAGSQGPNWLGLTVDLGWSLETEVMQCLTCHSHREAMQDVNPLPGTAYHDAFSLALLRPGLYHPDGSILDEVFEGGSFLQSRMHSEGVRCSNCHEPHAATLRAPGNAVCTQCHSPAGNADFPSLPLAVFDGREHHFHAPGSAGAECVACHMIERTYMGVDTRRDHSFRVPRPDLAATGSPDACTDCHKDRDPAWAAAELRSRFPASRHQGPHFATAFATARQDPALAVPQLLAIAEEPDGPGIVRATALEHLAEAGDAAVADRVGRLLLDPDPRVRSAAAGALRALPPDERLVRLAPLLADPLRAVREATAKALLDARPVPGTPEATALAAALREWWEALMLRADFPETHLQIGGAALTLRDFALALQAFGEAAALDPQAGEAWSMVVSREAAMGDPAAARATLARALAANPGNEMLLALQAAP